MSYSNREPKSPEISSLLPAPGWRAFTCAIHDDDETEIWEVPVVGFAVVRTFGPGEYDDEIKLFVYDVAWETGRAANEKSSPDDFTTTIIIPPGEKFDDEHKEELEKTTRIVIAARRKRAAKAVAA